MDFKDFIIGEKYNISALATAGSFAMKKYAVFKLPTGRLFLLRAEDFEAVSPENGIKNTETTPKYDPCRKFRKGDKVKLVARDGRSYIDYDPTTKLREGAFYTVLEDESDVIEGGCPDIRIADGHAEYEVLFYFLELVTPVEELEPYFVEEGQVSFLLKKGDKLLANYWPSHPNAKAAAVAERDRLNAEWRKEQSNA